MGLNVLLVPIGTEGDIHPYIGLGIALNERGHGVTLITNEYFRPLAERHGFSFVATGTADEYHTAIMNRHILTHPARGALPLRHWFCRPIPAQYDAVADCAEPGNTVILASGFAAGARIAHEKLGIPWAILALQPVVLPLMAKLPNVPDWFPELGKRLGWRIAAICGQWIMGRYANELRARLYLPPISKLPVSWWLSPTYVLGLFPDWYAAPLRAWDVETHLTGFVMYDGCAGDTLPTDVDSFLGEGEAPIVFTPGSGIPHAQAFFRTAVDTCRTLLRRGIFLTRYPDQLPTKLPPNIRRYAYVPFGTLLPRAAAIVHHGGIGTTAHALAAGIPQLVIPRIYDQPDNAKRVKCLGVGDYLKPAAFQGRPAARKLSALLTSDETACRCRAVARKFKETRPLTQTCELIEQVVRRAYSGHGSCIDRKRRCPPG